MADPILGARGDIAVEVEFDPVGFAGVYTIWCGATGAAFSVSNEIVATKVGDCADLTSAVKILKQYGAQDCSISIDANWTAAMHEETMKWALEQKSLNIRLRYPNATVGQVESVTGTALLEGLELGGLMNVENQPQSEQVTLQISGSITPVYKA